MGGPILLSLRRLHRSESGSDQLDARARGRSFRDPRKSVKSKAPNRREESANPGRSRLQVGGEKQMREIGYPYLKESEAELVPKSLDILWGSICLSFSVRLAVTSLVSLLQKDLMYVLIWISFYCSCAHQHMYHAKMDSL